MMTLAFSRCWNVLTIWRRNIPKLTAPVSAILAVAGVEHDWRANTRQTMHPTTLHYVWAREFGECKGKKHYHLMLLVNRDTWCRAGDYRAPGSLAGMIKQAWCSALGVDVGCHATLVHFPASYPAIVDTRLSE